MGTSGVSDSSSSRQGASIGSREDVSTLAARMRRESLQGRGTVCGARSAYSEHAHGQCTYVPGFADRCPYTPHAHHGRQRVQVVYHLVRLPISSLPVSVSPSALSPCRRYRPLAPVTTRPVSNILAGATIAYKQLSLIPCRALPTFTSLRTLQLRLWSPSIGQLQSYGYPCERVSPDARQALLQ